MGSYQSEEKCRTCGCTIYVRRRWGPCENTAATGPLDCPECDDKKEAILLERAKAGDETLQIYCGEYHHSVKWKTDKYPPPEGYQWIVDDGHYTAVVGQPGFRDREDFYRYTIKLAKKDAA
jgi:hypothetical protein